MPITVRLTVLMASMHLITIYNLLDVGPRISPGGSFPILAAALYPWSGRIKKALSLIDLAVIVFVTVSVGSVILYFSPNNTVSPAAYLLGLNVTVAPILLYVFGRHVSRGESFGVIRNLVVIHWLVVIFSLSVHFIRPDFYTNAISAALGAGSDLEIWQVYARLQGALGSTVIGGICAVSILMLLVRGFDRRVKWLFATTFFFGAFLSFQRAPMLLASMALFALWMFDRSSTFNRAITALTLVSAGVVLAGLLDVNEVTRVADRFAEALQSLSLDDRPSYDLIGAQLASYPLGMGLGATTSAADAAGFNPGGQIVDANHLRLLADLGPVGLAAFISIVALGLFRSIRQRSTLWIGAVIFALNLQAMVTNIFDSYYISHLYWMILGLLACAGGGDIRKSYP